MWSCQKDERRETIKEDVHMESPLQKEGRQTWEDIVALSTRRHEEEKHSRKPMVEYKGVEFENTENVVSKCIKVYFLEV